MQNGLETENPEVILGLLLQSGFGIKKILFLLTMTVV